MFRRFVEIATADPFSYEEAKQFSAQYQPVVIGISVAYVIAIFAIQRLMRDRKAFDLRLPLQLWNFALMVFSTMGAVVTGMALFADVRNNGLVGSYCKIGGFWHGLSGLWTLFFCYSKVAELGDTFLIVFRKKPLIFLHWYHHVATLNYAVLTYIDGTAFNTWIVWINFSVHAVMYCYFFVIACFIRVPPTIARCITVLQISQFIVTHLILFHIGYLVATGAPCQLTTTSYVYCLVMEISFVYLFGRFFYKSYIEKGGRKMAKKEQ